MKLLYRGSLLIILVVFVSSFSYGGGLMDDSASIEYKQPDKVKLNEFRSDKDFIYDTAPPKESWISSFLDWLMNQIFKPINGSGLGILFDILLWGLIIAVLVFIVLKIFKTDLRGLFQSKSATNKIHFIAEDEDIHELDFNTMIEDAIAKGNYREAIRLSYLKILKQLTDKDLIKWQLDKTNTDYYHELKQTKYQKPYKKVSLLFEYVWYGEFQVKEADFKNTMNDFKGLSNLLN